MQADQLMSLMQGFDAADNVLVTIAHDNTIFDPAVGIKWFPYETMNNWKANGSAERARWALLKAFQRTIETQ